MIHYCSLRRSAASYKSKSATSMNRRCLQVAVIDRAHGANPRAASAFRALASHRLPNSSRRLCQPPRTPPGRFDTQHRRHGQYVAETIRKPLIYTYPLRRIQELVSAQPVEEEPQERVRTEPSLHHAPTMTHCDPPTRTRLLH